jgi:hypothetical protein
MVVPDVTKIPVGHPAAHIDSALPLCYHEIDFIARLKRLSL